MGGGRYEIRLEASVRSRPLPERALIAGLYLASMWRLDVQQALQSVRQEKRQGEHDALPV
ncbi:hypothetical protein AERO8C_20296 [Aeromonas veronii]|uniref:Uncharacterized protein n=1 Tax=Aeromonas veronii TaxID=654 RepID=A0A653L149_AERVE|nr:hypothetical protein AERO8C_20296 [Aeromonas veronii]